MNILHYMWRFSVCSICLFLSRFTQKSNLVSHLLTHTGNNRIFSCDFCEKSYAQKAQLVDHIRLHTGERPFVCDMCGSRSVNIIAMPVFSVGEN